MVKSFIAVGSCVGGDKGNYSIILWHCSIRKGKTASGDHGAGRKVSQVSIVKRCLEGEVALLF